MIIVASKNLSVRSIQNHRSWDTYGKCDPKSCEGLEDAVLRGEFRVEFKRKTRSEAEEGNYSVGVILWNFSGITTWGKIVDIGNWSCNFEGNLQKFTVAKSPSAPCAGALLAITPTNVARKIAHDNGTHETRRSDIKQISPSAGLLANATITFGSRLPDKTVNGYIFRDIELKNLQFLIVSKLDHLWGWQSARGAGQWKKINGHAWPPWAPLISLKNDQGLDSTWKPQYNFAHVTGWGKLQLHRPRVDFDFATGPWKIYPLNVDLRIQKKSCSGLLRHRDAKQPNV